MATDAYNAQIQKIATALWALEDIVGVEVCAPLHQQLFAGVVILKASDSGIIIPIRTGGGTNKGSLS